MQQHPRHPIAKGMTNQQHGAEALGLHHRGHIGGQIMQSKAAHRPLGATNAARLGPHTAQPGSRQQRHHSSIILGTAAERGQQHNGRAIRRAIEMHLHHRALAPHQPGLSHA